MSSRPTTDCAAIPAHCSWGLAVGHASTSVSAASVSSSWPEPVTRPIWWLKRGVHLCLDGFHMGVGGDDSWSQACGPKFWLLPGRYQLALPFALAGPPSTRWRDLKGVSHT